MTLKWERDYIASGKPKPIGLPATVLYTADGLIRVAIRHGDTIVNLTFTPESWRHFSEKVSRNPFDMRNV